MEGKTLENVDKTKLYTHPVTGKFIKGNPGGGHPKGTQNFTTRIREALLKSADEVLGNGKKTSIETEFRKKILYKAIVEGDPTIIKLIWNYLDGMPTERRITEFDFLKDKTIISD
ncbi:MAG: hypothetical protein KGI50_06415 [Patescibacteria group bacterium]|nr:hypothetical protein [Patescibacteria group bacterium]MDE2439125.1 hypothetical protein [Patescibacteria group bacterium]